MSDNPVLFSLDLLDRAEEFFHAFRLLPPQPSWRWVFSWPRYFLLCHAVELGLKAFLASRGVPEAKLRTEFGHKIEPLMQAAIAKGLNIGCARSALITLDEAHAKHWPRYPSEEGKPLFVFAIEYFEPHARELLREVAASIRGSGPSR